MWKQSHTFFCSKTTKTCIFQLDLAAGFHAHFTSTACSCTSLYILWLRHVSSLLSIIHCQIFHNRDIRKRASPNCMNTYLQSFFIGRQQQGGTAFSYTARAFAFPVDFMNFKVKVTNIQSVFLQKYLKKKMDLQREDAHTSTRSSSQLSSRMDLTRLDRLRWIPEQFRHTNTPILQDAQSGSGRSTRRFCLCQNQGQPNS